MHRTDVQKVICGGGEEHTVCGTGTVVVQGDQGLVRLLNTLYVPTFMYNRFSGTAACKNGATMSAKGTTLKFVVKSCTVISADAADGLFVARAPMLNVADIPAKQFHATALSASPSHGIWHKECAGPISFSFSWYVAQRMCWPYQLLLLMVYGD
jgi:hypothetical protein